MAGLVEKLNMALDELVAGSYGKASAERKGPERSEPYASAPRGAGAVRGADGGNRRVFVGNLPYSASWQDLKDHMRAAGTVLHCDVIAEPGTAMGSKGCGLVEFSTAAEARRAIRELSETTLNGRTIYLREDREAGLPLPAVEPPWRRSGGRSRGSPARGGGREPLRAAAGGGGGGGGGGGSRGVFIGNLPYSVTWQELKDHMRAAGDVVHCDIIAEPGTAMGSKGCGLVTYATAADARRAIQVLSETTLKGRPIFVREDREAGSPAPRGPPARAAERGGGFAKASLSSGALSGRGGGGGGGGAAPPQQRAGGGLTAGKRVFVGNLPYSVTWKELKDHMRAAGHVVHCDIMPQPGTTLNSKGCGLVEYSSSAEARRAIRELTESTLGGRPIFVREDRVD